MTLDVPYLGRRLNENRNNFSVPEGMEWPNLFPGVDVTNLNDGDDLTAYGKRLNSMPCFRFSELTVTICRFVSRVG